MSNTMMNDIHYDYNIEKSDYDLGVSTLKYYYDFATAYSGDFSMSFNDFISYINKKNKSYIEGLGLGIKLSEVNPNKVMNALELLAYNTDGGIPDPIQTFTSVIQDKATSFDFYSFSMLVGEDLAKGSQYVGDKIIETGKGTLDFFSKYHKLIIIIGGIGITYYYMKKAEKGVRGALGGLKSKARRILS